MTTDELKAQRDAALQAALSWDEKVKHSRYGCLSDQERSTELWRKVKNLDWQIAQQQDINPTTGDHQ